ncbi:transcriptional regulator [uncultured Agrococcus sp.]|uniref:transcriptional regulator n=1 Tax=uncultured Agrococcus sp. TaxID=382258 RepID=UPI0025FF90A9|nr:transcriptional regulator [uncultured Agrococcus sp.]
MATDGFDPVIHPPPVLRICAFLEPVREEDFVALRDLLGTSDSTLNHQLETLAAAHYIDQWRFKRMGRNTVRIALSASGRRAFRAHLAALERLVEATPEQRSRNA